MREKSTKIRVLRIIARMNIGGPAIQVTNLMQSLPDTRFEQLLVSGFCEEHERDYLETHQFKFHYRKIKKLGRAVRPFSDLKAFHEIRSIIKDFEPHIIHTHTFKAGLIGRIAARSLSRRVLLVHTFHGHLLHGYFGRFGTRTVIVLERWLARRTTRLISVGAKVQEQLLEHGIGVPQQFEIINPGFNIAKPGLISRDKFGFAEDDFICGWFGRITKIKRADRVIEIAAQAKFSNYNKVKFLIVGDGETRHELEALVLELNLPVVFLGWQTDVSTIMSMCDLVFCTSENEGTPISLIEAQMLSRPVISTNVGSVQEVILSGKTGFTLEFNPQEYWEKIRYLFDNPIEYQRFSHESSIFALNYFSLEKFIRKHVSLYDEILRINPILRP